MFNLKENSSLHIQVSHKAPSFNITLKNNTKVTNKLLSTISTTICPKTIQKLPKSWLNPTSHCSVPLKIYIFIHLVFHHTFTLQNLHISYYLPLHIYISKFALKWSFCKSITFTLQYLHPQSTIRIHFAPQNTKSIRVMLHTSLIYASPIEAP